MLCELRIRDLLLIKSLELRLDPGFNALTGETGAGKSIVVGALQLVLGGRASPEQVRPGCDQAEVEALFDLTDSARSLELLDRSGIPCAGELVVRRRVPTSGRSQTYLNGRLSTASELASLAPELADISSQHEHVSLTDPGTHLAYLDAFGGLDTARNALSVQVDLLRQLVAELAQLQKLAHERAERDAFLRFQLAAIEEIGPRVGEMESLRSERTRLRSAGRLGETARRACERLTDGDSAICDELHRIAADLQAACKLDSDLDRTIPMVQSAVADLSEVGNTLSRYAERVHDDPDRLATVEDRLFRLERLLRLHGPEESDVLGARDRLAQEILKLEAVDADVEACRGKLDAALARSAEQARTLSATRKRVASKLGSAITEELSSLGMGDARVVVDVAPLGGSAEELAVDGARLGRDGIDHVEFLIAPNKGIAPRPLRKIASGGELSRALLALKRALAAQGPAGLYVFDEVDAGVGGAVAERIGQALADISRHRQVLCITHLAPIAAFADAHFAIKKAQDGDVATSVAQRLTSKLRVREIARMLSGSRITQASLAIAAQMVRAPRVAEHP